MATSAASHLIGVQILAILEFSPVSYMITSQKESQTLSLPL